METRDAKLAEITTPEVLSRQLGELTVAERESMARLKLEAERRAHDLPLLSENGRESEALLHAAGHLFERASVLSGRALAAEALNTGLGFIDHYRLCAQGPKSKLVALDDSPWLHASHATAQGITLERWAVGFVDRTRGTCAALGLPALEAVDKLSPDQRRVVEEILGSKDQVVCLRGAAGVGKTTVLRAMHTSLEGASLNVLHCTPTTSAADTMRKEGLPGATTVCDFLCNVLPRAGESLRGAVLVVDEAGLASNRDGVEILQAAERWNARILFVGDSRQHTSVEAGDFLRVLERHSSLQRIELDAIRRQQTREYREAIQCMAGGAAREGLDRLDALGWVHEHGPDYLHEAADAVVQRADYGARLDRVIAVTPTWAENHALTASIRAKLKVRGILHSGQETRIEEPLAWTEAQKRRAESYQTGMIVTFTKGRKGVARGTTLPVVRVDEGRVFLGDRRREVELQPKTDRVEVAAPRMIEVCAGDRLLLRANDRDRGFHNGDLLAVAVVTKDLIVAADGRAFDPKVFRRFTHGFAVTSHKSQSKTAEHVVVAAARLGAKAAYVACSRGRTSVSLHVPAKKALLESLPPGNRTAALDLLPPVSSPKNPPTRRRNGPERDCGLLHRAISSALWCRRLFGRVAEWWQRIHSGRGREFQTQPDLHR